MHSQSFATLEFDRLRTLVGSVAQTDAGRAMFEDLEPLGDRRSLQDELDMVGEGIDLERRVGGRWSFSELADPTEALSLLQIEGAGLDPLTLLALARLCDQALAARALIIN